jgi:hypothetical protein
MMIVNVLLTFNSNITGRSHASEHSPTTCAATPRPNRTPQTPLKPTHYVRHAPIFHTLLCLLCIARRPDTTFLNSSLLSGVFSCLFSTHVPPSLQLHSWVGEERCICILLQLLIFAIPCRAIGKLTLLCGPRWCISLTFCSITSMHRYRDRRFITLPRCEFASFRIAMAARPR